MNPSSSGCDLRMKEWSEEERNWSTGKCFHAVSLTVLLAVLHWTILRIIKALSSPPVAIVYHLITVACQCCSKPIRCLESIACSVFLCDHYIDEYDVYYCRHRWHKTGQHGRIDRGDYGGRIPPHTVPLVRLQFVEGFDSTLWYARPCALRHARKVYAFPIHEVYLVKYEGLRNSSMTLFDGSNGEEWAPAV